jgi:hypothetical protein
MNIKEYYGDVKKKRAELEEAYQSGEVFLMSVFQRGNSVAGQVCTATQQKKQQFLVVVDPKDTVESLSAASGE